MIHPKINIKNVTTNIASIDTEVDSYAMVSLNI